MSLQALIQQIKQEYRQKSIAPTRYYALDKVTTFLSNLETRHNTSAIDILKGVGKKEFKLQYLNYKTTQPHLSDTLSGAEQQAINDLYKKAGVTLPSTPLLQKETDERQSEACRKKESKDNKSTNTKKGLPPMVGAVPKILILGTMPGNISLEQKAYYRNESRNKFWEIIHSIFHDDTEVSYEELLKKHHIALWDCLKEGSRAGSTDNGFDFRSLMPNDLEKFLRQNPSIETILLNGKGKSSKSTFSIFNRFFSGLNHKYKIIALSSTSNANTKTSTEQKLKEWSILRSLE